MSTLHLPTINAALNATSALFLLIGFLAIKNRRILIHRAAMRTAFAASAMFLASYLYYHYNFGSTRFTGTGLTRTIYFLILISHTILAAVIVPLVLRTFYLSFRERFEEHKRLARWTFPLWMYVSVTGVVIYWMLYRI